jgi:hypothetical protein
MIGTTKLKYSLHQAAGLEALLSRQERSQTPENNPQPEASQTNLSEDDNKPQSDTEEENLSDNEYKYPELGGSVCIEGDIE